jgi:hypothetical protein
MHLFWNPDPFDNVTVSIDHCINVRLVRGTEHAWLQHGDNPEHRVPFIPSFDNDWNYTNGDEMISWHSAIVERTNGLDCVLGDDAPDEIRWMGYLEWLGRKKPQARRYH